MVESIFARSVEKPVKTVVFTSLLAMVPELPTKLKK